jgi:uncharacterized membrane protein YphA (DoxX/SURF4 family)
MDYYRSPQAPAGLIVRDVGLLLLRWFAGLALIFYHAREEVMTGWRHVWYKTAWPYAAEITDRGFPLPEAVAIVSAVVALLGSALLVSGLLCRISALALLACSLCALFLYASVPPVAEKLVLYTGVYLVLVLCGPGRFSLDAVLVARQSKR